MLARIYHHFLKPKLRLACAKAAARAQGLRAFKVLGANMEPTLRVGEVALYTSKYPGPVVRGDVVVVSHPAYFGGDCVPLRVVGLPGDNLEIKDGQLLLNGQVKPEPYLFGAAADSEYSNQFASVSVPEAHAFMLGDYRDNSNDSRLLGPVPLNAVVGKVGLVQSIDDPGTKRVVR